MQSSYYTPGKLFGVSTPAPKQPAPVVKAPVQKTAPTPIKPLPIDLSTNKPNSAQLKPIAKLNQEQYKPSPNPHGSYLSGNILQKALDVVMTIPYGISGFWKGELEGRKQLAKEDTKKWGGTGGEALVQNLKKGQIRLPNLHEASTILGGGLKGIIPGIQNRTQVSSSPGDVNAVKDIFGVKNKTAQTVGNFGLSLAQPTLPIGKVAGVAGRIAEHLPGVIPAAEKTAQTISNFAKETPAVYKTIETFNPFFRNKEAGKVLDEGTQIAQKRIGELRSLIIDTSKGLSAAQQKRVGQVLEGGITNDPAIQKIVSVIRPEIQKVGKEAQELGYLSKATIDKFKDGYMPHTFENSISTFEKTAKPLTARISGNFFKERKGAEGYIKQYAPAVFKGIGTEIKDIETGKAYRELATKFGTKIAKGSEEEASKFINNDKIAKIFKGIKLPNEIIDYVNRTDKISRPSSGVGKVTDSLLNYWKAAKTIYNPAYHIRNLLSNQILSNMSTGESLPKTLNSYIKAVAQYKNAKDPIVNIAHDIGLIKKQNFYDTLEQLTKDAGLGAPESKLGVIRSVGGKINDKIRAFQQVTEDTAKLSVFKTWIKKYGDQAGVKFEQALKDPKILDLAKKKAEEAIFSPYRISSSERNLVGRAIPFYSFARQAAPFTLRTLLNNPGAIAKYEKAKTAVESLSSDQGVNQSDRPGNLQGNIRLPATDDKGAQTYLDPTYIYPYGNFTDIGFSKGQLPFGLSLNPLANEFIAQTTGKDQYTGQPIGQSPIPEEAIKSRLQHAQRTFEPTIVGTIQDKIIPALQGKTDYLGRTRSKVQALIDTLGIKTQKITPQALRSKSNSETNAQLRSLQQAQKDIQNDQSLTPAQREAKLNRLREIYNATINP